MSTAARKLMDGRIQAFPVIAATNTTISTAASTTHSLNLPSGITAGDILFLVVQGKNDAASVSSFSQAWNLVEGATITGRNAASYWRVADGTEGSTTTATFNTSTDFVVSAAYRVTGSDKVEGTATTGSSTAPNPPALEPSWGLSKTLWAMSIGSADSRQSLTAYPTNYTLSQLNVQGGTSSSAQEIWLAAYENEAISEDPGAGTLSSSLSWLAATYAFRPIGASTNAPIIASSATWDTNSTGGERTNYSVTLPSGIQSGDMLLMFIGVDGATDVLTHTGWTSLAESTANSEYRYILGRIADGTEGSSASFTSSATEGAAAVTYRITGARNGLTSSEIAISSVVEQNSNVASADPPSLTPSWGSAKTLWIAVTFLQDGAYGGGLVYPLSYNLGQSLALSTSNAAGSAVFSAGRHLTAATEDPGSFTWSSGRRSGTYTLAVRPA